MKPILKDAQSGAKGLESSQFYDANDAVLAKLPCYKEHQIPTGILSISVFGTAH
jgi:hypothetical protein